MTYDAFVAGAGIVGVSVALHLQRRGRSVALIDRRGPGEETSFGNAGLIERSSVVPYAFPRAFGKLIRYGFNDRPDARYHLRHLPRVAPWMLQYWRHSGPKLLAEAARAMLPLIERCVAEHDALMHDAGTEGYVSRRGWVEAFRSAKAFEDGVTEAEGLSSLGLSWQALSGGSLQALEPNLSESLAGAIHWQDPVSVSDPGAVTKAYAALFEARGGRILSGDARTLQQDGSGRWTVRTEAEGTISARDTVIALGPWSDDVFRPLGYRFPLAVKRGYHIHYRPKGNAVLGRPVVDVENGYVLAPMTRGIRLTTGAEFADRDAPPTPVQIARTEPLARTLFPLAEAVDDAPWMGRRPALPDMRPVIGPAPKHTGLWFAFGHAHHGFTLGPVTGRLLAEMITGGETVVDPTPYAATRFR